MKKRERDFLHDLSTPLATAALLLEGVAEAQRLDSLKKAMKALVRAMKILEDRRDKVRRAA